MRLAAPLVLMFAMTGVACSGSDASSSTATDAAADTTGMSTGDASTDSRIPTDAKCYFAGDVTVDGMTRRMVVTGCAHGTTNAGATLLSFNNLSGGSSQVQIYLDEPIAPGQTGAIRVDDIKVTLNNGTESRKFVGTACTLNVTRNEVISGSAFDGGTSDGGDAGKAAYSFRMSGSGSCSAPFTPETTGTLSVGPFEIQFEVNRSAS